jgi:hypothetical protein
MIQNLPKLYSQEKHSQQRKKERKKWYKVLIENQRCVQVLNFLGARWVNTVVPWQLSTNLSMKEGVLTLQNFSNKHTADLENVQGKKKNKKD